ncbi:hypothetical protein D3OALGA1CA_1744 [Olavius algarvensis associated proteobacterium Delta 3]|nr:hypothetical protein D3OALGA1CA_1744 [Olavius algarvensis associated proteobacterium Delta 3]CAB5134752.1 hypothetical protein D3OALGB2SA_3858 [Olavius algarvensis associated proteobacterium Delta 3]
MDAVLRRCGLRATFGNLMLMPRGETSLRKLIRMFDEDSSKLGRQVVALCMERYR